MRGWEGRGKEGRVGEGGGEGSRRGRGRGGGVAGWDMRIACLDSLITKRDG